MMKSECHPLSVERTQLTSLADRMNSTRDAASWRRLVLVSLPVPTKESVLCRYPVARGFSSIKERAEAATRSAISQ